MWQQDKVDIFYMVGVGVGGWIPSVSVFRSPYSVFGSSVINGSRGIYSHQLQIVSVFVGDRRLSWACKNNAIKIFAVIIEELEALCNYFRYVIHLSYINGIQEMKTKRKRYAALILQKIRNIYGHVLTKGLLSRGDNNLSNFVVSRYRKLIFTLCVAAVDCLWVI